MIASTAAVVPMQTSVTEDDCSAPSAAISVIIPTYNAEKHIAQTLESVLAQTVTDWTLTVIDDGSRDDTCAVVEQFVARDSRVRLVRQENAGAVAARNRGLTEVDPAALYVILLDHDDVWEPDALWTLRAALETHPEAVAAHGLVHSIDGMGQPTPSYLVDDRAHARRAIVGSQIVSWPLEGVTNFAALCVENWIITPGAVLIRRSALQKVGPLDPSVYPCDDWDLWLRLSRHGDLISLPDPVLRYRLHDNNASHDQSRMGRGSLRFRHKALRSAENTPEQKRILRIAQRHLRAKRRDYFRTASVEIRHHLRDRRIDQARQESLILLKILVRYLFWID